MFPKQPQPEHWVPNDSVTACSECQSVFTVVVRRHHCRRCGGIFCSKCCQSQAEPEQRVCTRCSKPLSNQSAAGGFDAAPIEQKLIALEATPSTRKQVYAEVLASGRGKLGSLADEVKDLDARMLSSDIIASRCKLWYEWEDAKRTHSRDSKFLTKLAKGLELPKLTTGLIEISGILQKTLLQMYLEDAGHPSIGKRTVKLSGLESDSASGRTTLTVRSCNIDVSWPKAIGLLSRRIGLPSPCTDSVEIVKKVEVSCDDAALHMCQRYAEQFVVLSSEGARAFSHCIVRAFLAFLDSVEQGTVGNISRYATLPQIVQFALDTYAGTSPTLLPTRVPTAGEWSDVGVYRETGVIVEGVRYQRPGAALPLKYGSRVGTLEEVRACELIRESSDHITVETVPPAPPGPVDVDRLVVQTEDALVSFDLALLQLTRVNVESLQCDVLVAEVRSQPKACAFYTRVRAKLLLVWVSRYTLDDGLPPPQVSVRLVGHPVPTLSHVAMLMLQLEVAAKGSGRSTLRRMHELAHMVSLSIVHRYRAVVLALNDSSALVFADCCVARFLQLCEAAPGVWEVSAVFDAVPRLGDVTLEETTVTSITRLYLTTEDGATLKEHNLHGRGALVTPNGTRYRRSGTRDAKYPDLVGSTEEATRLRLASFGGESQNPTPRQTPLRNDSFAGGRSPPQNDGGFWVDRPSSVWGKDSSPALPVRSLSALSRTMGPGGERPGRSPTLLPAKSPIGAPLGGSFTRNPTTPNAIPQATLSVDRVLLDASPRERLDGVHLKKSTLSVTPKVCSVGDTLDIMLRCRNSRSAPCVPDPSTIAILLLSKAETPSFTHVGGGGNSNLTASVATVQSGHFALVVRNMATAVVSNFICVESGPVDWGIESEVSVSQTCVAGQSITCRVVVRDALGNRTLGPKADDFLISCPDAFVSEVLPVCETEFVFTLTPYTAGTAQGTVTLQGVARPFAVAVQPSVVHFGSSLLRLEESEVVVGADVHGTVHLRDAFGNHIDACNDIEVTMGRLPAEPVRCAVTVKQDHCSFVARTHKVGVLHFVARYLRTSECLTAKVDVVPSCEISAAASSVRVMPSHMRAGATAVCTLVARDEHRNVIDVRRVDPAHLRISVRHADGTPSAVTPGPPTFHAHCVTFTVTSIVSCELVVAVYLREHEVRSTVLAVTPSVMAWEKSTVVCVETAPVGEPVTVTVVPKDAFGNHVEIDPSRLTIMVTHQGHLYRPQVFPPQLMPSGEIEFSFTSTKMGRADVCVTYGGHKSRSVYVTLGSGVVEWGRSILRAETKNCVVGETLVFRIETRDTFGHLTTGLQPEDFTVIVTSTHDQESSLAPSSVRPGADSTFTFSCTPKHPGIVTAAVTIRTEETICAEDVVVLASKASLEYCAVKLDHAKVIAGRTITATITARDKYGNATTIIDGSFTVKVSVRGRGNETITPTEIKPLADLQGKPSPGMYSFSATPKQVGVITISIDSGDSETKSFTADVVPAAVDWKACRVTTSTTSVVAGEAVTGTVFMCDTFENPVAADTTDIVMLFTNEGEVIFEPLQPTPPGTLEQHAFSFTPKTAGKATILARYRHEAKPLVTVTVLPATAIFDVSSLTWDKLQCVAGECVVGTVTFKDKFNNVALGDDLWSRVEVQQRSPTGAATSVPVKYENGRVVFECVPTRSGDYIITVTADGALRSMPVLTARPSAVHWPSCELRMLSDACAAGQSLQCVVTLRDACGNATNGVGSASDFAVSSSVADGFTSTVAPTTASGIASEATQWTYVFSPTVVGAYTVSIRIFSASEFPPLTCSFNVVCDNSLALTQCLIEPITTECAAGEKLVFVISLFDKFNNPAITFNRYDDLTFRAENDGISIHMEREVLANATVRVTTAPTRPGPVQLWATLDSVALPRHKVVTAVPGPALWDFSTIQMSPTEVPAGGKCVVLVTLRDAFGNVTSLAPVPPMIIKTVFENNSSEVKCETLTALSWTCEPVAAGKIKASATCEGSTVIHTMECRVVGVLADPSQCRLVCTPGRTTSGAAVTCHVSLFDRYGNIAVGTPRGDLTVAVLANASTPLATSELILTNPSEFTFSFTPLACGFVDVTVNVLLRKGTKESLKPAKVVVTAGPIHLPACTLQLMSATTVAGNSVDFTITLRDAQRNRGEQLPRDLLMFVENQGRDVSVAMGSFGAGVLRGSFVPVGAGIATLIVTMRGTSRLGEQQAKLTAAVEVEPGPIHLPSCALALEAETMKPGDRTTLSIIAKDQFGNVVKDARRDSFDVRVINNDTLIGHELEGFDGRFTCIMRPNEAGTLSCQVTSKKDSVVRTMPTINVKP